MDLLLRQNLYYAKVKMTLSRPQNDEQLFEAVVNTPFLDKRKTVSLGLGITVLLLRNKKDGMIDRIALSNTDSAKGAVRMSAKPFNTIRIPEDDKQNIIALTVRHQSHHMTSDWRDMFVPALTAEQARFNQAGAGIGCSVVYPLKSRDGGAMIFSYYLPPDGISEKHHDFMQKYSQLADKALESKL